MAVSDTLMGKICMEFHLIAYPTNLGSNCYKLISHLKPWQCMRKGASSQCNALKVKALSIGRPSRQGCFAGGM